MRVSVSREAGFVIEESEYVEIKDFQVRQSMQYGSCCLCTGGVKGVVSRVVLSCIEADCALLRKGEDNCSSC